MPTRIAAVGEADTILPFKAIGVETYPIKNVEEARQILDELIKKEVGIIFITDEFACKLEDCFEKTKEVPLPSIVSIPGSKASTGFAVSRIRTLVRRAVGVDIMEKKGE